MNFWDSKPNKPTDIDKWDDVIYDGDDFTSPPHHSSDDIDDVIDDEMFMSFMDGDSDGDSDDEPESSHGFFTKKKGDKKKKSTKKPPPQVDSDFPTDDFDFDDKNDGDEDDGFTTKSDNTMKFKVSAVIIATIVLIGFGAIVIANKLDESSNSAGGVTTIEPISPQTQTQTPTQDPEPVDVEDDDSDSDSLNPTEEVGSSVSSEGKDGGHDSGINAIIAYDNAFYLDRSPEDAWEYNSPNNNMTKAKLEEAILGNGDNTGVAPGTEYVATITPKVVGKTYDVELELTINGKSYTYSQVIEVEEIDGKFYVKNIKNSN